MFLKLDEAKVIAMCRKENVGVSAIERLPGGGVRLVCMSSDGAQHMITVLKPHLLDGDHIARQRSRPKTSLW